MTNIFYCPKCKQFKTSKNFVKVRNICRACDRRKPIEKKEKSGRKPCRDIGEKLPINQKVRNCMECGKKFISINEKRQCPKCSKKFKGEQEELYQILR